MLITGNRIFFYRMFVWHPEPASDPLDLRASASIEYGARYTLGTTLGSGAFAVVKQAFDKLTNRALACKVIPLGTGNRRTSRANAETEIRLMRRVESHPGIVAICDAYEMNGSVHIVTDLLKGGDMLTALEDRGSYSEDDARQVFKTLISALAHIHAAGVVHRDIKLENLVLAEPHDVSSVRLIDFGLAADLSGPPLHTVCGTPHFVAPEVIKSSSGDGYGRECDMWGAGVVLFQLLSGYLPFDSLTSIDVMRKIYEGKANFKDPVWSMVSRGAIDLTKRLLTVDPRQRPTTEQALMHPWVVDAL